MPRTVYPARWRNAGEGARGTCKTGARANRRMWKPRQPGFHSRRGREVRGRDASLWPERRPGAGSEGSAPGVESAGIPRGRLGQPDVPRSSRDSLGSLDLAGWVRQENRCRPASSISDHLLGNLDGPEPRGDSPPLGMWVLGANGLVDLVEDADVGGLNSDRLERSLDGSAGEVVGALSNRQSGGLAVQRNEDEGGRGFHAFVG